uniref:Uncharacterized protein n=1 Tax=viral metagenome TaxID=1070528 RepID=A0A6M3JVN5_9ZZZZ
MHKHDWKRYEGEEVDTLHAGDATTPVIERGRYYKCAKCPKIKRLGSTIIYVDRTDGKPMDDESVIKRHLPKWGSRRWVDDL